MNIPSYPTDRASVIARGLANLRDQVKSTKRYLETMQDLLAKYEQGSPAEQKQVPEFRVRVVNLTDVLLVLKTYIELGEQERRRLAKQSSLSESEISA